MKAHLAIATLAGAIISTLFAVFNGTFGNPPFVYLQFPGYIAIVILWGPHGGAVSELVSEAVLVGINAIFYGLIIFGILHRLGRPTSQVPKD